MKSLFFLCLSICAVFFCEKAEATVNIASGTYEVHKDGSICFDVD